MRYVLRSLRVKAAYVTTITRHLLRLSVPFGIEVPGRHTFHGPLYIEGTVSDP